MPPSSRRSGPRRAPTRREARWIAGAVLGVVVVVGFAASSCDTPTSPSRRDPHPASPAGAPPSSPRTAKRTAERVRSGDWRGRLRPPLAELSHDLPDIYARGCQAPGTVAVVCADGTADTGRTVLTIGDSHAASWQPALARLADLDGWQHLSVTKTACTVWDVPTSVALTRGRYRACEQWRHNAFALAARRHPDVVILHSAVPWNYMLDRDDRVITSWDERARVLRHAVISSVRQVRASGATVVVMLAIPFARGDVAACLATAARPTSCDFPPARHRRYRAVLNSAARAAGAVVVDPYRVICPGRVCHLVRHGIVVYRNPGHLTTVYVLHERRWISSWLYPLLRLPTSKVMPATPRGGIPP